jgi:hypothetical protein
MARPSYLAAGGGHPSSRQREQMILQILIGGRFRQAHAFAGEVQAFLIGCYAATPIGYCQAGARPSLSHRRLVQGPLPAIIVNRAMAE